jgi:hypothetical protein
MKKVFSALFVTMTILMINNYLFAYVNCEERGDCIRCEDDEAREHPDGGCVTAEHGCVVSNTICGY